MLPSASASANTGHGEVEERERSCEVRGDEPVGVARILRAECEAELAVGEHVGAVGECDGSLGPLLDEEDGEAGVPDLAPAPRRRRRRSSAPARATARRAAGPSGSAASARPIASCCCWPPDSAPAWRERNSCRIGKSSYARAPGRRRCSRFLRPASPRRRFSSTVSSPKMRRPSGTSAMPRRATSSGRRPTSERPSSSTSPPAIGAEPMIACSVDDFPAPFGPIRPTIWPGFDLEREPAHGVDRSVPDRELLDRQRRHAGSSAAALSPR